MTRDFTCSEGEFKYFNCSNSRGSVREFTRFCGQICVQTRVLTGSEHLNSRISTGSNSMFPYVNSRDSVVKFVSRHVY